MDSWARQTTADGNNALGAQCWLAVGKGEEAAELLARLGDKEGLSCNPANEGDRRGKGSCIADTVCIKETLSAMKLLEDQKN